MKKITVKDIENAIRNVPDFPKKGIMFKDITTVLKRNELFAFIIDYFENIYKDTGITKIACIEARGFIIGGALASRLNAGFVPIRKHGKLPAEKYTVVYELEYGTDSLEVHTDAFENSDIVLIHDDLLATGGSAKATYELVSKFNVQKIYFSFLCDLAFLEGKKNIRNLGQGCSVLVSL